MAEVDAGRRRRWLVIGLAVAAFFSMTGAWFLLPGVPDVQERLTPDPDAVSPPPLPPPSDGDAGEGDTDGDGVGEIGPQEDTGSAFGGPLGADTDAPFGPRTEDGTPLRVGGTQADLRDAILPSDGTITALSLSGEVLIATVTSDEGSFLQVLLPDAPERRIVRLQGVPEAQLSAARARDPVRTRDGWLLLAADATGRSRVWALDLDTVQARPIEGPPGSSLEHLAADGALVGVVVDELGVWLREGGGWRLRESGARPIEALSVSAPSTALLERAGAIERLDARYTVAQPLGAGREPVVSGPLRAWRRDGRVRLRVGRVDETVFELGPTVALTGPDAVVGGGSVSWLRADGRVGLARRDGDLLRLEAVEVPVGDITAIAVDGTRVAVAGQDGPVQRVVVME